MTVMYWVKRICLLAGLITGFYAQLKDPLRAAVLGVFVHAYAADLLREQKSVYSIIPSDVIEMVEKVLFTLSEEVL